MAIIFFSTDTNTVDEWVQRYKVQDSRSCYDIESLQDEISNLDYFLLICDYDTIAHDLNKLIASKSLPNYSIVLEKSPALATGKMLIKNGVRGYGNSRMLVKHFNNLLETVLNDKTWTYPELTAALIKSTKKSALNTEANELIDSRLSAKEKEVLILILEGLTNDTIGHELNITTRTVKAHISSIFSKLHVNDRISLVLLLK